MIKSFFEIAEMTELGKQVYQIVEDGNPQGKYVIVGVDEWEEFESAQQKMQPTSVWAGVGIGMMVSAVFVAVLLIIGG